MAELKNTGERRLPLTFYIYNRVRVPQATIIAAKKAARLTWEALNGGGATFNIAFEDYLVDKSTGKRSNLVGGIFAPHYNFISLGVDSSCFKSLNMPLDETAFLFTSHETVHKKQIESGDTLTDAFVAGENYQNLPEEIEAWDVALHIFKKAYPHATGGFSVGNRRYEIPRRSRYR